MTVASESRNHDMAKGTIRRTIVNITRRGDPGGARGRAQPAGRRHAPTHVAYRSRQSSRRVLARASDCPQSERKRPAARSRYSRRALRLTCWTGSTRCLATDTRRTTPPLTTPPRRTDMTTSPASATTPSHLSNARSTPAKPVAVPTNYGATPAPSPQRVVDPAHVVWSTYQVTRRADGDGWVFTGRTQFPVKARSLCSLYAAGPPCRRPAFRSLIARRSHVSDWNVYANRFRTAVLGDSRVGATGIEPVTARV